MVKIAIVIDQSQHEWETHIRSLKAKDSGLWVRPQMLILVHAGDHATAQLNEKEVFS